MKNQYHFFYDAETTGFSPMKNDPIEIAVIIAKKEKDSYIEIDSFHGYMAPMSRDSWTRGAEFIHEISQKRAYAFPDAKTTLIKLLHFLVKYKSDDNDPLLFVAHDKTRFDFRFLEASFLKNGLSSSFRKVFSKDNCESTVRLADKYKDVTGLENSKLNVLAKFYNIKLEHHSALSDTNACFELFKIFKNMGGQVDMNI